MEIEYRKFSEFKRGSITELLTDAYSFDKRYEIDRLSEWIIADDFFYDNLNIADNCGFVTTLNSVPIGFICWDPRSMPYHAEIGHNCIKSAYKGKGYGKLQLKEAVKRISEKDVHRIIVTTDEELTAAQKNYESVGFRLIRTRENTYNPDHAGKLLDYELII